MVSMVSALMVMSVVTRGVPPPSNWYSGAPKPCAHRSYSAISTAALALVLRSSAC